MAESNWSGLLDAIERKERLDNPTGEDIQTEIESWGLNEGPLDTSTPDYDPIVPFEDRYHQAEQIDFAHEGVDFDAIELANRKYDTIKKYIFKKLDSFDTYEQKHKWMDETVVDAGSLGKIKISEIIDDRPELNSEVNSHMLETAMGQYGDPTILDFTFAKDVSNEKLLETLDLIRKNEEIIESRYGGQEGYEEMHGSVVSSEARKTELRERKKELLVSLHALNKEWDESGPQHTILSGVAIPAMQLFAGWTDWFRNEGQERIENRVLTFKDGESYGQVMGPKIGAIRDQLSDIKEELDLLNVKDEEYAKFKELDDRQNDNLNAIATTIIDDLLLHGYSTEREIRSLLGD